MRGISLIFTACLSLAKNGHGGEGEEVGEGRGELGNEPAASPAPGRHLRHLDAR